MLADIDLCEVNEDMRVLLIDEETPATKSIIDVLKRACRKHNPQIERSHDLAEAAAMLEISERTFDLIVCGETVPETGNESAVGNGYAFMVEYTHNRPHQPVIILSDTGRTDASFPTIKRAAGGPEACFALFKEVRRMYAE